MKSKLGFRVFVVSLALLFLLIGCKQGAQQQGREGNQQGNQQSAGPGIGPGAAPGTPGQAASADDAQITSQVQARISSDDTLKTSKINVETNNGVVKLTGNVPSTEAVDKAAQMAQGVTGVTSVQNDLTVG